MSQRLLYQLIRVQDNFILIDPDSSTTSSVCLEVLKILNIPDSAKEIFIYESEVETKTSFFLEFGDYFFTPVMVARWRYGTSGHNNYESIQFYEKSNNPTVFLDGEDITEIYNSSSFDLDTDSDWHLNVYYTE